MKAECGIQNDEGMLNNECRMTNFLRDGTGELGLNLADRRRINLEWKPDPRFRHFNIRHSFVIQNSVTLQPIEEMR